MSENHDQKIEMRRGVSHPNRNVCQRKVGSETEMKTHLRTIRLQRPSPIGVNKAMVRIAEWV